MGGGRFDTTAYASYSSTRTVNASTGARLNHTEIFKATKVDNKYDPKNISLRESIDSETSPKSLPIIVALDFSGSMGSIAGEMANNQLGVLMTRVVSEKVVDDPHLMFMGVGDVRYDRAPLQVTQFEADIRIAEQLADLYNEQGGGNNDSESYTLPWYFATFRTSIDSVKNRGKKGYLFTIGDEMVPPDLTAEDLTRALGAGQHHGISNKDLLKKVSENFTVFHIIAEQGSYCRYRGEQVYAGWSALLGNRALMMSDYTKVSDIITAAISVNEGHDVHEVLDRCQDQTTRRVVERALFGPSQQNSKVA